MPSRATATGHDAGEALVVGAGGFIGSHLIRALQHTGDTMPGSGGEPPPAKTVYFVAGRVTPSSAERSPEQITAEIASFRALLTSVACEDRPPRVVFASSGGTIYAPAGQPPYREDDAVAPNNAYGDMKLAMEQLLLTHPGVEPVVVRLANVYGPGQRPRRGLGVVAHWIHAVAHGQPIVVYGDPCSSRDFLYIDDAVDLLVRLHCADQVPTVVNAGCGVPVSLEQLARLILDAAGRQDLPTSRSAGRAVDRLHVWLDVERARVELGWQPRTSIREGLARTWASAVAEHVGR